MYQLVISYKLVILYEKDIIIMINDKLTVV